MASWCPDRRRAAARAAANTSRKEAVVKCYTGIGSRSTPPEILRLFKVTAARLADAGWTLRSGAAPGADTAFEEGVFEALAYYEGSSADSELLAEIYLPWSGFEGRKSDPSGWVQYDPSPSPLAFPIAEQFHPAWDRCSQGARRLHARNVHQVLGQDVTNPVLSRFVLCWTPDGSGSGGTGQALRIAKHYGVPIIDAGSPAGLERVERFVTTA